VCTIDGQWSTLGSAHLDLLSSVINYELNSEVNDAAFAAQMQKLFAHDIAEAHELPLTTRLKRPWYWKPSEEHMLAPFRFLLRSKPVVIAFHRSIGDEGNQPRPISRRKYTHFKVHVPSEKWLARGNVTIL
jgi:phosphatidylserine/phosphatidylglycerophosphate/cardiolipin synthase-like enzyme